MADDAIDCRQEQDAEEPALLSEPPESEVGAGGAGGGGGGGGGGSGKKKKKGKKGGGKKGDGEPEALANPDAAAALGLSVMPGKSPQDVLRAIQEERMARMLQRKQDPASVEHKFWDTQPVRKLGASAAEGEEEEEAGPIEIKCIEDVRPTPYTMPAGFEWCNVDILNDDEAQEVYTLLCENYVEDDDEMFRFDYSVPFLRWALTTPGFSMDLHVGVRNSKTGKLFGFISAVPATICVRGTDSVRNIQMVEINFLCVHKKLRSKRLAPVLIKEVTRRVNLRDVWQAVYTAGVTLPTPMASCRYFHRSLNPKKLVEVRFSHLHPRMTMARMLRLNKLPDSTTCKELRPLTSKEVSSAQRLVMSYLPKFKLHPVMNEHEFAHWLLPREGVVDTFVKVDKDGEVTDICSFYHLPSTVIGDLKHKTLFAAYSFYNVATTVPLTDLMKDALIIARNKGMDVFNALNLMDNDEFLEQLHFGKGDGNLQYYLYNWRCPKVQSNDVGLVML
jgi:glycylpeptide N-tetradecanoyltransferase